MNIHNLYQHNGLRLFIDSNNIDDIEMNCDSNNGGVSRGIGLINSYNLYQFNESSCFGSIYWDVESIDVSGGHFFMKSHTLSEAKNQTSIDSTNKRYGNVPNVYEMEDTGIQDKVDIGAISSSITIHQYSNI